MIAEMRKPMDIVDLVGLVRHVAPPLLYSGNISTNEGAVMKLLISTMFKKVPVRKTKQRACICKRCGVRIYSLNFLKHHLEAHERATH
jgi:hypothetical protein